MSSSSSFPPSYPTQSSYGGEDYLKVPLPDFEANSWRLTILLGTSTLLFWTGMVVLVLQQRKAEDKQSNQKATVWKSKEKKQTPPPPRGVGTLLRRGLFYWLACCFLILGIASDWNTRTTRTVFQVPLFSPEECKQLLDIAASVAHRNYEAAKQEPTEDDLLREPLGWHKTRPEAYQTTDLQPAVDPFTSDELDVLRDLLDRRLGPTVARVYGVPVGSIRAHDMFVARYEAGVRTNLPRHIDDADASFNILLSTDFTGGGTRFVDRWSEKMASPHDKDKDDAGVFYHARPSHAGTALLHNSQIEHEGYPIQSGTRFILVGFLGLDRRDPFSGAPTGMGLYASWFNFQWAQIRLREYVQRDAASRASGLTGLVVRWTQTLSTVVGAFLLLVLDAFGSHEFQVLVEDTDGQAFRDALDRQFDRDHNAGRNEGETGRSPRASWLRGQQINVHPFTGLLESAKKTRRPLEAHFQEL